MNEYCNKCVSSSYCDMYHGFFRLMHSFAEQENTDLKSMTINDYVGYFSKMIDDYVEYMDGHITPQVVYYVKNYMLVENYLREEV
jgi:hypothetical protein